jgi:hypothetical protein
MHPATPAPHLNRQSSISPWRFTKNKGLRLEKSSRGPSVTLQAGGRAAAAACPTLFRTRGILLPANVNVIVRAPFAPFSCLHNFHCYNHVVNGVAT